MKTKLMLILSLLISTSAFANTYTCNFTGDEMDEEFAVEINLKSKKAAFFDNDNWSVIKLKSYMSLESFPPQDFYTFEGKDTGGRPMAIYFNKTHSKGYITESGTGEAITANFECEFERKLRSGI